MIKHKQITSDGRKPIKDGCALTLNINGGKNKYIVETVIGYGGSCIVYKAVREDAIGERLIKRSCVIKEFYPYSLPGILRNRGRLIIPPEEVEQFNELKKHFENGIAKYVGCYENDPNHLLPRPEYGKANNTIYAISDPMGGAALSDIAPQGLSIFEICQIMNSLCNAISKFHKQGLLYLDIKPDNIFLFNKETNQPRCVALFDFDTLAPLSDLSGVGFISGAYSEGWAPIEQKLRRYSEMRPATDIYAMGALFFWLLSGRQPTVDSDNPFEESDIDKLMFSVFDLQNESKSCAKLEKKPASLVIEILNRCLKKAPADRYQNIGDLQSCIRDLMDLTQPSGPAIYEELDVIQTELRKVNDTLIQRTLTSETNKRLISNIPPRKETFIGRENELKEMDERLERDGWLMLSGMGGIGKTEIVIEYIHRNISKYNTISFLMYDGSLLSTIGLSLQIDGYETYDESRDNLEHHYNVKMSVLRACGGDTLLIIDNFDQAKTEDGKYISVIYDRKFTEVRSCRCKVIFTSRAWYNGAQELWQLEEGDQLKLFYRHYTRKLPDNQADIIPRILERVKGHTLAIMLIAKTLLNGRRATPQELLDKLSHGIKTDIAAKVTMEKNGEAHSALMYDHINALFDLSALSDEEKYILMNMSLVPNSGINAGQFGDWIHLEDFDAFVTLTETGWIELNKESDTASLHPVISDVAAYNLTPDNEKCKPYLESLLAYLNTLDEGYSWAAFSAAIELCESAFSRVQDEDLTRARILVKLGELYRSLSIWVSYNNSLEAAKSIYEKSDVVDDLELAEMYKYLGRSYFTIDDSLTAIEASQKALDILKRPNSENYLIYEQTIRRLGIYYRSIGEGLKAIEHLILAKDVLKDYISEDDIELGYLYNDLSLCYNTIGDYNNSLECSLKALEIKKLKLPPIHKSIAISYHNIGFAYFMQGRVNDSIECYMKSLEIKQYVLPANHNSWSTTYDHLGSVYTILGNYEKALEYLDKAALIRINLDQEYGADIALTYKFLADLYRRLKQYDQAISYIDKSLALYKKFKREKTLHAANALEVKGDICFDQKLIDDAQVWYTDSYNIRIDKLGEDHPHTAESFSRLGDIAAQRADIAAAIEYYDKAIAIKQSRHLEKTQSYFDLCHKLDCIRQCV